MTLHEIFVGEELEMEQFDLGVSSRNGKNRTLSACHVGATVS